MAKISELPIANILAGDEFLPIVHKSGTKRATLAAFRDLVVPFLQYWYKGDRGDVGEAANTFDSLARMKALDPVRYPSAILADGINPAVTYAFVRGDFQGRADDREVVELDSVELKTGALVRSGARGVSYRRRTIQARLDEIVSVMDFGAAGDGETDDILALEAARDTGAHIYLPFPNRYFISRPLMLKDGQRIYGGGKSAWEPYSGDGGFPDIFKTELVVDGTLGIDVRGKNNVAVSGISIRARHAGQSSWGALPNYQPGSRGIDITGSSQFEAEDVSFLGLEVAIDANQDNGNGTFPSIPQAPTQMPKISGWMASDVGTVFRFGTELSGAYTVRDALISNCVVALHCGLFLSAHWCDGVRLENNRLFHCQRTLDIRATPFVTINGFTSFETVEASITLRSCIYATLAGVQISRSGAYRTSVPYASATGLVLQDCADVCFSGQIVQPTGYAIEADRCTNLSIKGAIGTPFWTNGNDTSESGAVMLRNCVGTSIHASFGGTGHRINVWADVVSARTLSGAISGQPSTGVVRAVKLQQQGGLEYAIPAALTMGVGGVAAFATLRRFIPAGKKLMAASVSQTSPTVQLRVVSNANGNAVIWNNAPEPDGGTISYESKPLYDNSNGPDGYYSIELTLRNPPGGDAVTVPAGHEVQISTIVI